MTTAKDNAEALRALNDAAKDVNFTQGYIGGKDYYGRTKELHDLLSLAWNAIYDARKIMEGNHK